MKTCLCGQTKCHINLILSGLTFLCERNLSSDGVDEEHLAGGNPWCLFHEAEPQLGVGGVAVITIQRLHLHERDP